MENKKFFNIIIYIIILFIRIVCKSLGIIVLNDFFLAFYIHTYLNVQISFIRCRSPPIMRVFEIRIDWRFFCGEF